MREFLHDLVAVERKGIDVRAGVRGALVLGVVALAMAVVGTVARLP